MLPYETHLVVERGMINSPLYLIICKNHSNCDKVNGCSPGLDTAVPEVPKGSKDNQKRKKRDGLA